MATQVHRLNEQGLAVFRGYLEELRGGAVAGPEAAWLTDPAYAAPVAADVAVEARPFASRLEAARYLDQVLAGVTASVEDVGLWSWLSLFFFDAVCPEREGRRRPGADYRHVLEPGPFRWHHHVLAGPFAVYRLHGSRGRALLCSALPVENQMHHQLASRQALLTNPAVIEVADRLYYDPQRNRLKRGTQSARTEPGTLLRFIAVIQQLEVNYDLYSMSPEAILGLLPGEFSGWVPRQGRLGE